MDQRKMKKMTNYIEKVIKEAFVSEGRRFDYSFQTAILDDTMFLVFRTNYNRVNRRICFRLKKNFFKNFGVNLFVDCGSARFSTSKYDLFIVHKNKIIDFF